MPPKYRYDDIKKQFDFNSYGKEQKQSFQNLTEHYLKMGMWIHSVSDFTEEVEYLKGRKKSEKAPSSVFMYTPYKGEKIVFQGYETNIDKQIGFVLAKEDSDVIDAFKPYTAIGPKKIESNDVMKELSKLVREGEEALVSYLHKQRNLRDTSESISSVSQKPVQAVRAGVSVQYLDKGFVKQNKQCEQIGSYDPDNVEDDMRQFRVMANSIVKLCDPNDSKNNIASREIFLANSGNNQDSSMLKNVSQSYVIKLHEALRYKLEERFGGIGLDKSKDFPLPVNANQGLFDFDVTDIKAVIIPFGLNPNKVYEIFFSIMRLYLERANNDTLFSDLRNALPVFISVIGGQNNALYNFAVYDYRKVFDMKNSDVSVKMKKVAEVILESDDLMESTKPLNVLVEDFEKKQAIIDNDILYSSAFLDNPELFNKYVQDLQGLNIKKVEKDKSSMSIFTSKQVSVQPETDQSTIELNAKTAILV